MTVSHRRLRLRGTALAALLALALADRAPAATPVAEHPSTVATDWMTLIVDRVKQEGYSPLIASRIYGYAGVTLYETLVPGMPDRQSLAGQLHELPALPPAPEGVEIDWPAAASAAMAGLTKDLFPSAGPSSAIAFRDLFVNHNLERIRAGVPRQVLMASRAHGNRIADAILAWAATDGFVDRVHPYDPPAGPGQWVPTGGSSNPLPLEPYWWTLRTFALPTADSCAPVAPEAYSEDPESAFYQEVMAVYEAKRTLTPEGAVIAHFWADNPRQTGTPPGHSISITTELVRDADLATAAEAYGLVGPAVADAFIACWWAKYHFNLVRPESVIRQMIDPTWKPLISTPPFPEYTSGHSVQSGAANAVLVALFGDEPFVDATHAHRGLAPREFPSLTAAFEEAAVSRLYGGIHYPMAIEEGLVQGRCVGATVFGALATRR